MHKSKPVSTPLAIHFKLSKRQSLISEKEKAEMKIVPYLSTVGNLMYVVICTRPNIAYAVGVVSRFLTNSGKEHRLVVK